MCVYLYILFIYRVLINSCVCVCVWQIVNVVFACLLMNAIRKKHVDYTWCDVDEFEWSNDSPQLSLSLSLSLCLSVSVSARRSLPAATDIHGGSSLVICKTIVSPPGGAIHRNDDAASSWTKLQFTAHQLKLCELQTANSRVNSLTGMPVQNQTI